jgi:N-acetylneuraminic acid mutarotase
VDASGNLWLFGGFGLDSTGNDANLNDLWKFSPSSGEWTWVGGYDTGTARGVYGTEGVAAASNFPGGRYAAVSWIDSSGNAWLFGGQGVDSMNIPGYLNDLWEYPTQ